MKPIRVLIADDHALFREGVRAILKSVPDIEIVGEAGTGQEALKLASNLKPDVILMDIQMPDLNGVEATQRILKPNPTLASSSSLCSKMMTLSFQQCAPARAVTY